ncbi:MAG: hypothetical protein E7813_18495 [Bradyrhizobium sp.]|nr:MAG: hypothetical protein E7813_18495 [Bradyrhizobium sp.]
MDKLNLRERRVFEARVLTDNPMSLEDLAAEFGIARVRIRQIEVSVLQKMGHDLMLLALEQEILADKNGDHWNRTIETMIDTNADSLDGVRAKARVACSNRLGDLDEAVVDLSASHNDRTLENSILRDLIRLYDPHLEQKGAVQALLIECTT